MKRTNDFEDYEQGDISLPSPTYSEPDHHDTYQMLYSSPTKRIREPPQTHDLNLMIDDQLLDFIFPNSNNITTSSQPQKKFRPSPNRPVVLVFFGVLRDHLDEINESFHTISKCFQADVLGVSVNLTRESVSHVKFPLINGTVLTRAFNARDPMGGGIYPKDMLIFFDKLGKRRCEVLLRYNGKSVINKPASEMIKDILEEMEMNDQSMIY